MKLSELFGKKVKQIRESRGLTQQKLAELCGMQTPSIGMIEIGKRSASFATVELLADKLNVDYKDLFNFDEEFSLDKSEDNLKIELCHIVSGFNKKQLNYIVDNARAIQKYFKKKN